MWIVFSPRADVDEFVFHMQIGMNFNVLNRKSKKGADNTMINKKRTANDLQNITQQTNDRATKTP